MKIVAAVFADFLHTFLGTGSRLTTTIGRRTVLAHTLTRLAHVEGLAARCLFVRPRDSDAARTALDGCGLQDRVELLPLDDGQRPRAGLMRSARKWNLASWRGGPLCATWFDEFVEPACVARVSEHYQCDGVFCVDGHQCALDPTIASGMIAHLRDNADAEYVFCQGPPGLVGILLTSQNLTSLLQQQCHVGIQLGYRPEVPRGDPITRSGCYQVSPHVGRTNARLTADTLRGRELLSAAFQELGETASTESLCEWLLRPGNDRGGPLPIEVELELTTADPLPNTTLRPRGDRVPRRECTDLSAVSRLARELGRYDDRLIVLGGHGDPLLHPRFPEICAAVRAGGVCGLAVVTPLVELSDACLQALVDRAVDVVEIRLDAFTRETYQRVHNAD